MNELQEEVKKAEADLKELRTRAVEERKAAKSLAKEEREMRGEHVQERKDLARRVLQVVFGFNKLGIVAKAKYDLAGAIQEAVEGTTREQEVPVAEELVKEDVV